jgi:hypothetical protein
MKKRKKKEKLFLSLSRVFGLFLFVRAKKIFLLLLCDISHMRVFRRKSVRGILNSSFFSTHSRYAAVAHQLLLRRLLCRLLRFDDDNESVVLILLLFPRA